MPAPTLSRRSLLFGVAGAAGALAVAPTATAVDGPGNHRGPRWGSIALVPVDDRPYTWFEPPLVATSGGYRMITPPRELLGNHFTPGDGDGVRSWLTDVAADVDNVIVATVMLAFGGLLNSRNSSVPLDTAMHRLEGLRTVRQQAPRRRLFAFDTIMRLTPEGPWRNQLRVWAVLKDEVENLGMEEKRPDLDAAEAEIPADVRDDYLATRARNHQINLTMIDWAAEGIFDYLVIGQDDASGNGLHRPEADALSARITELGIGDRVVLFPGADVLASLLVAKIAMADADLHPRFHVEYSRVHGDEWTAPYQNVPYAQLIDGYCRAIGGSVVDTADDADIVVMANTGGSSVSVEPFADRLVDYVHAGRRVALGDDAIAGRSDPRLLPFLNGRIRYAELAGYSGWNIGLSIAQSAVRWGLDDRSRHRTQRPATPVMLHEAAKATVTLAMSEWVQTDSYRNHVRDDTTAYARSLGEADPQNIQDHYDEINAYAVDNTLPIAEATFVDQFADAEFVVGAHGRHDLVARVGGVNAWNLYLPWRRTGEIAAEPVIDVHLRRR